MKAELKALKKKDDHILGLFNAVDGGKFTINCDVHSRDCNESDELISDGSIEAADEFYNMGWRTRGYKVYCPSCTAMKLKSEVVSEVIVKKKVVAKKKK